MLPDNILNQKIELAVHRSANLIQEQNNPRFLGFLRQNFLQCLTNPRFIEALPPLNGDEAAVLRRTDTPWDMPGRAKHLFDIFQGQKKNKA